MDLKKKPKTPNLTIIKYIPGFRSETPIKMCIGTLYYVLCLASVLSMGFVMAILMFAFTFSFPLILLNAPKIVNKEDKGYLKAVLIGISLFFVTPILMSLYESQNKVITHELITLTPAIHVQPLIELTPAIQVQPLIELTPAIQIQPLIELTPATVIEPVEEFVNQPIINTPKESTVYWTREGSKYHRSTTCRTLRSSSSVYDGTVAESGKNSKCGICY